MKQATKIKQFDPPLTFILTDKPSFSIDGESFTFLSTTVFSDSVFIHPVPKTAFVKVEEDIEEGLEHEHLHLAIYGLHMKGAVKVSCSLDNISPRIGCWKRLIQRLELKETLMELGCVDKFCRWIEEKTKLASRN